MTGNAYTWIITNHRYWNKKRGTFGTLDEFADYLGMDHEQFNHWLTRKSIPSVEEALQMCKRTWEFSLMETLGYLDDIFLPDMDDKPIDYILRLKTATMEGKRVVDKQKLNARGKEEEREEVLTKIFSSYHFRKTGKKA